MLATFFRSFYWYILIGRGVDGGYDPPKQYEIVFPVGETCASPNEAIPIIDDRISEETEEFYFSIIDISLPLGVEVENYFTIEIEDDDSKYSIYTFYVSMNTQKFIL